MKILLILYLVLILNLLPILLPLPPVQGGASGSTTHPASTTTSAAGAGSGAVGIPSVGEICYSVEEYITALYAGKTITEIIFYIRSLSNLTPVFWRALQASSSTLEVFQLKFDLGPDSGSKTPRIPANIFTKYKWPSLKCINLSLSYLINGPSDETQDNILINIANASMPKLKDLGLMNSYITVAGTAALAASITLPNLQELHLGGCRLKNDSARIILTMDKLKYLDLQTNFISSLELSDGSKIHNLEVLDLSNNTDGNDFIEEIANASFVNLKELYLRQTRLVKSGAEAIIRSFHLPKLRKLNFKYNKFNNNTADVEYLRNLAPSHLEVLL